MWIPEILKQVYLLSGCCELSNSVALFVPHAASSLYFTPAFAKVLFELSSLVSHGF